MISLAHEISMVGLHPNISSSCTTKLYSVVHDTWDICGGIPSQHLIQLYYEAHIHSSTQLSMMLETSMVGLHSNISSSCTTKLTFIALLSCLHFQRRNRHLPLRFTMTFKCIYEPAIHQRPFHPNCYPSLVLGIIYSDENLMDFWRYELSASRKKHWQGNYD